MTHFVCSFVIFLPEYFYKEFCRDACRFFAFRSFKICGPKFWKQYSTSGTSHSRGCLAAHWPGLCAHPGLCFFFFLPLLLPLKCFVLTLNSQIWENIKVCYRSRGNSQTRKSSIYKVSTSNASYNQQCASKPANKSITLIQLMFKLAEVILE